MAQWITIHNPRIINRGANGHIILRGRVRFGNKTSRELFKQFKWGLVALCPAGPTHHAPSITNMPQQEIDSIIDHLRDPRFGKRVQPSITLKFQNQKFTSLELGEHAAV